jgi:predicted acylesterase/phospholipase RssA
MVIGTSTGSIIAGAIAVDYSLKDIVRIFEKKSSDIFRGCLKSKM